MLISDAFAQAAPETTATTAAEGAAPYELSFGKMMSDTGVFLILLFGIFYFLLIRPQQRRLKQYQGMLETIKKGSRVVTSGGIIGQVHKLDGDDVLVVEIAPNVKVRIMKSTISEVIPDGSKLAVATANDN